MNAPLDHARLAAAPEADSRFSVPGIKCAGCIGKIEREMGALEGVSGVRVNLSAKRVAVRHDPALGEDALIAALGRLGFEAQTVAESPVAEDDREARSLMRALAVAGFGMMNIMLLSVSVWSGAEGATRDLFHLLSAMIALPVIAYAGRPFFASAARALRHGRTNMDVPISIGVVLATGLSLYEALTGGEHAYFDGATMLLFFLLAGRALDASMRGRTRAGIGALLSRMGKSAMVVQEDGCTRRVAARDIEPGSLMLVAAGEALAADGVVESGASAVDNAMLTGESAPEPVGPGTPVHAGAVNITQPLRVRVTATAQDTVLAEIARLMDEAGQSRSHYVRIADRASRLYAPLVHTIAALSFAGWMWAGAGWHESLVVAIAVLIITCPCAMGLAVPAAQVVAAGALMRRGLLIKDGSALERLAEVDCALFDKTGTLTLGEPVPDLRALDARARAVALALAQHSRHPLSRGLEKALAASGVVPAALTAVVEHPGEGIFASWSGEPVALQRSGSPANGLATQLLIGEERWQIPFSDDLRGDAAATLADLWRQGIESSILSGDRTEAVAPVARRLALFARGHATPQDKLAELTRLRVSGRRPLMVGDGLNDGPALAAAHASIAPGTASDISQQAADAVFTGNGLMPVALAVRVARQTMRVVRQNFAFAIGYNLLAVPLAVAGLVTPLVAAVAMSVSSLVVVANSLRLARAAR
ncbi:putative copper-importing P-type ATPase A [Tsuneonella dongtanensis]|uniref:Putative copper-importing P-type ATPase A n=1 Tax=Tsuneonella dongtanensis TaxID=692370 RepID=A0A1B2ABW1_9SPHN|nr:heavy metal translocating P-type ATPase [Tsuneonella dongtanensis]ANY19627.1 putative copper-importing P-type ATPase A [Tsuneonella dongtanensis]